MKRLALLTLLTFLTSCTWLPGVGGAGGNMGSGASGPTLKDARLEANTALPGQAVTITGVPEVLGEVTATLESVGGGAPQTGQLRREDASKVTLAVPIAPKGPDQAGDVEVTLSAGTQTSPKLKLRILALPPVDPEAMQKLSLNTYVAPILAAQAMGIEVDHAALEGDPADLPEAIRPVAFVHALLNAPTNPYSLRALAEGTSPLDQEDPATADLTRRLLQSSGFIDALGAYNASRVSSATMSSYKTFGRYFAPSRETSLHQLPDLRMPLSPQILSGLLQHREKIADMTQDRAFKASAYAFDTVSFVIGWTSPYLAALMSMGKFAFDLTNDLQLSLLPGGYKRGFDDPALFTRPLRDRKGKPVPYPRVEFKVEQFGDYAEWSNARVTPVTGTTSIDIGKALNLFCAGKIGYESQRERLKITIEYLKLMSQKLKVDGWLVFDTYVNHIGLYQVFGEIPGQLSTLVLEYRPVDVTPYCSIYQPGINNIRTMAGNRRRFAVNFGKRGILKIGLFSDGLYLGQAMEQTSGAIAGGAQLVDGPCTFP